MLRKPDACESMDISSEAMLEFWISFLLKVTEEFPSDKDTLLRDNTFWIKSKNKYCEKYHF